MATAELDLESGTLEVVHALQRVGGELRFVRPKTEDSERTIPLPDLCVEALKAHKEPRTPTAPTPGRTGRRTISSSRPTSAPRWSRTTSEESWGRIRKRAGLDAVRFHDIRHTCVSLLLDLGVRPHIVRDIVCHSDIEVTMTIYPHAALDEKRKALQKLRDALDITFDGRLTAGRK